MFRANRGLGIRRSLLALLLEFFDRSFGQVDVFGHLDVPGAYARTATQALTHATLPYALKIANLGGSEALRQLPELVGGLNTHAGAITCQAVAEAHGMVYHPYPTSPTHAG